MFHKNWKSFLRNIAVTSLAEVWIETLDAGYLDLEHPRHFPCGSVDWNVMLLTWIARQRVTSLAEVWIETPMSGIRAAKTTSLPLRKCGLKHTRGGYLNNPANVTSLAEVWIETETHRPHYHLIVCHFPCGSVDWNYAKKEVDRLPVVTSLAEVWIETDHSGPGKT